MLEYRRAQKVLIEPMDGKAVITNIDGECTPADVFPHKCCLWQRGLCCRLRCMRSLRDRAPAVTA